MTRRPPPFLGHDGAITLAAALAVAALTFGIAPLLAARAVRRTAMGAGISPAEPPARILVLGHRLAGAAVSPAFAVRLERALVLAQAAPAARVLVLGGRTSPDAPAEAEAGRDWLLARGLDPARIWIETGSRHTIENLANHRATHPVAAPEALVTCRLHLHRALLTAHGMGLKPLPAAAEPTYVPDLPRLLTEGFLVHWYGTGRFLAQILRRRLWLSRID